MGYVEQNVVGINKYQVNMLPGTSSLLIIIQDCEVDVLSKEKVESDNI